MSITQKAGIVDLNNKTVQFRIGDNLFYGVTTQKGKGIVISIQSCVMSNLGVNTPYIGIENLQGVDNPLDVLGAMSRCAYGSNIDTYLNLVYGSNRWIYNINNTTVAAGIIGAGQALYIPNLQGQIMFSSAKGYTFTHELNQNIVGMSLGGYQFFGQSLYSGNIPLVNTYYSGAEAQVIALKMPTVGSYTQLNSVAVGGRNVNIGMLLNTIGNNYKMCTVDGATANNLQDAVNSIPNGGSGQVVLTFSNGQEGFVLTRYY